MRLYHVLTVIDHARTRRRYLSSGEPMTHREACTFKSKFPPREQASMMFEEFSPLACCTDCGEMIRVETTDRREHAADCPRERSSPCT